MLKEIIKDTRNPNKVLFNFYPDKLSDVKKNILCDGLNFLVKLKSIECSKFLLTFELLFWDVNQENLCSENFSLMKARDVNQKNLCCENFSLMKARLLDTILSSYESFFCHRSPCENLTTCESIALKRFSKNKNIVI